MDVFDLNRTINHSLSDILNWRSLTMISFLAVKFFQSLIFLIRKERGGEWPWNAVHSCHGHVGHSEVEQQAVRGCPHSWKNRGEKYLYFSVSYYLIAWETNSETFVLLGATGTLFPTHYWSNLQVQPLSKIGHFLQKFTLNSCSICNSCDVCFAACLLGSPKKFIF